MPRIITHKAGKVRKQGVAKASRSVDSAVDARTTLTPADWLQANQFVKVKSSNVEAIAYDMGEKVLRVKFLNTPKPYRYYGVHPNTARAMFSAASMGKYVWKRLRDQFPYDQEP